MARNASLGWLTRRPIAHRGLHDGNVAVMENSLPAALAAIEGGYAIECDVMLSSDGVPVVFHDATLERLTSATGRLADRTADELAALRLGESEATIPTVADFLGVVAGRVPIVMELKGSSPSEDLSFMDNLLPVIEAYEGDLVLMSFDPWLIDQALAANRFPVGLTAEGTGKDELAAHKAIVERGCAFVSYNVHHLPNPFTEWLRAERGAPLVTWTVRTAEEVAKTRAHADQMTFEGFVPQD